MKAATQVEYEQRVLRVQQHIEERLAEDLSPQHLAQVAGFSLHHFHRIFRGLTGESVLEYRRRLRLEQAARRLRTSNSTVIDVALETGYQAHEAFTRAFSRHFGVPPRVYRQEPVLRLAHEPERKEPKLAVEIRQEPERVAVAMRHTGPYQNVGVVWERLIGWVMSSQIKVKGGFTPVMFGLVPDDPDVTELAKLRYDACLELAELDQDIPEGPVVQTVIASGRYAVVIHEGSYDDLAESYLDLIGRWFPQSGLVPAAAPVVEHYLNSPHDTAPGDLKTEIRVLIDERGWVSA